jgi:hypothetical protein
MYINMKNIIDGSKIRYLHSRFKRSSIRCQRFENDKWNTFFDIDPNKLLFEYNVIYED